MKNRDDFFSHTVWPIVKAFLIMAAVILTVIAVSTLLSSCASADNNRRVVNKYYVDEMYASPKGCVVGTDAPCAELQITHYYIVVVRCNDVDCQTEFVEVNKALYDRQEVEQE
jgi:hypothetical protein